MEEVLDSTVTIDGSSISLLPDGDRWLVVDDCNQSVHGSEEAAKAAFASAVAKLALSYANSGVAQVYAYTGHTFAAAKCGAVVLPTDKQRILLAWNLPTGISREGKVWWMFEGGSTQGVSYCSNIQEALRAYAELLKKTTVPSVFPAIAWQTELTTARLQAIAAEAELDALLVEYSEQLRYHQGAVTAGEAFELYAKYVLLELPPHRITRAGALRPSRQPR